jgi:hypothetical protein
MHTDIQIETLEFGDDARHRAASDGLAEDNQHRVAMELAA